MDQLNIGVTTDAAKAADDLTKVSSSIEKVQTATEKMNAANVNASRLIAQNEAESRRFIAALQEEINTYGKGREEVLKYRASQLGISKEAEALVAQLKQVHGGEIGEAGKQMEQFGFQTAGAKRELLVLAHEASQGNWKRFAGSLMVVGERTNAMGLLFSSTGLALGAMGAVAVAVSYDIFKMSQEIEGLNKTFALTNNYAALTRDSFASMASGVQSVATGGISKAKEMLAGLAATGKFTGGELETVTKTALSFAALTGQSSDEVIKKFDGMSNGVAKWAAEANSSYHFLTAAQYEEIETLEKQDKSQLAVMETMKLFNAQMNQHKEHVGLLTAVWKGWGIIIDDVNAGLQKTFFPTVDEQIKSAIARLNELKKESQPYAAIGMNPYAKEIDAQKAKLHDLIAQSNKAEIDAGNKQKNDLLSAAGISAHKRLEDQWTTLAGSIRRADDEIKKFRADTAAALAANPNDAVALDAQKNAAKIEDAIRKKYNKTDYRADNKLNNAYTNKYDSLGADKAKLDEEIAEFQKYGKVVDKSALSILNFEIASGKLKGLSQDRIEELRKMASAVDADAVTLSTMKQVKAIEDKIKAVQAEAKAETASRDATKEALLMKDLDAAKASLSTEKYKALKDEIHAATQELEKHDAATAINTMERGTADKIAKLQEEVDLIGKSALERKEYAAALEIEAKARAEIAKYPDQANEINASARKQKADYNSKAEAADSQMKSWSAGMQNSLADFMDTASNDAANAKKLFTDAFQGAENAFVKFVETGKLSFKGLADSIISDLIRIETQKAEAAFLKMISSDTSTSPYSSAEEISMLGGMFADGGDPPVGVPSLVGEQGPEIFVPKTAGTIVPNNKIGGGPSVNYSPQIHIDSRTDQAQVHALVTAAVQRGNAQLVEHLQRANKLRN
jgi:phage-related minor tail protein